MCWLASCELIVKLANYIFNMDRDTLIFLARLAEVAERYGEMMDHMKAVAVNFEDELSTEDGNLIAVAFKNEMVSRRAAWRVIQAMESNAKDPDQAAAIHAYRLNIEGEVRELGQEVLATIDDHILPKTTSVESQAFFHKMKGDYYRYMAEIDTQSNNESAKLGLASYDKAWSLMTTELPPTHPLRLGLALNFSVFYSDIMNSPDRAIQLAKQSFDDAIEDLEALSEDNYRDATLIMQMLRDNVTLWLSSAA
ncbi:hypothetical protein AaE_008244 [Aphanomyces astaci]|uniref:14-3-3 domain-containing protein n=1 Tax=Aphanomyces astaci TaxID=112090 RepID=A0A6A5A882_APHAT|nr:hypothetical protein AaE_008244 [Aphanomyces astaci]